MMYQHKYLRPRCWQMVLTHKKAMEVESKKNKKRIECHGKGTLTLVNFRATRPGSVIPSLNNRNASISNLTKDYLDVQASKKSVPALHKLSFPSAATSHDQYS
ncbi:hypothetical protein Tco_0890080 [Tanacetum coccineum]